MRIRLSPMGSTAKHFDRNLHARASVGVPVACVEKRKVPFIMMVDGSDFDAVDGIRSLFIPHCSI